MLASPHQPAAGVGRRPAKVVVRSYGCQLRGRGDCEPQECASPHPILAMRFPRKGASVLAWRTVKLPQAPRIKQHKAAVGDTMTSAHRRPPANLGEHNRAYNLFRNRQQPELMCAVPEDRPVPSFIGPEQWTYERPLRPLDHKPAGFHGRAAHAGVRFNGFYLFQTTATGRQAIVPLDLAA